MREVIDRGKVEDILLEANGDFSLWEIWKYLNKIHDIAIEIMPENEWIWAKDRLPDKVGEFTDDSELSARVLMLVNISDDSDLLNKWTCAVGRYNYVYSGDGSDRCGWIEETSDGDSHDIETDCVVAWMPLPKPPELVFESAMGGNRPENEFMGKDFVECDSCIYHKLIDGKKRCIFYGDSECPEDNYCTHGVMGALANDKD